MRAAGIGKRPSSAPLRGDHEAAASPAAAAPAAAARRRTEAGEQRRPRTGRRRTAPAKAIGWRTNTRKPWRTHRAPWRGGDELEFHRRSWARRRSAMWCQGASRRSQQDALEMGRVVRRSTAASRGRCRSHSREVQKRSAAARISAGSSRSFGGLERAHAARRRRRRRSARSSSRRPLSRSMHQSLRHDGDVEEPGVDAGEVEVEQAGRGASPSNMTLSRNRSAWIAPRGSAAYAGEPRPAAGTRARRAISSACAASRKGTHDRHGLGHHARPRRFGCEREVGAPPGACARASRRRCAQWAVSGARWCSPGQPVDHRGRLALERRAGSRRSASACGSGTGMPRPGEMLHQVQVERQLVGAQALEQRQHPARRRCVSAK